MKILFFSDTHGDFEAMDTLKKKSKEVDLVVCAGDITQMERDLKKVVFELNEFDSPVILVNGNHEDARGLRDLCNKYDNLVFLHKAVHHIDNFVFMGYGGDGFSRTDTEFEKVANAFFKEEAKGKDRVVLITHGPPYNSGIDLLGDDPRGNESYKNFIEEVKPHIAVSGHLHENFGKHHKEGRTLFLNPGNKGVIVEL